MNVQVAAYVTQTSTWQAISGVTIDVANLSTEPTLLVRMIVDGEVVAVEKQGFRSHRKCKAALERIAACGRYEVVAGESTLVH